MFTLLLTILLVIALIDVLVEIYKHMLDAELEQAQDELKRIQQAKEFNERADK